MLAKFVRGAALAIVAISAGALPASAQTANRLGWLGELSGSCYQGVNAAGAVVDRQCFRDQFGHFLRASITRGSNYRGESVMGFSNDRRRLEVYAWTNGGETAILTPTFVSDELVFAGENANGVATRAVWRRGGEGAFQVADQQRTDGAWADATVTTYRRDGAAAAAFSAGSSIGAAGSGFGWLDQIAGRCYLQVEPRNDPNSRGCFAFQYRNVLRQTWYAGGAVGEAVLVRHPASGGIAFFHWDARGNFGVGQSSFSGRHLVSMTDTTDRRRRVLSRSSRGFTIETQQRSGQRWEYAEHHRYSEQ
ncbi:MAG: hypothetical protein H7124_09235 [Phycisphaerales bacterium]|nr:hypothetical protein [Hyphomonadaceae bacterium]